MIEYKTCSQVGGEHHHRRRRHVFGLKKVGSSKPGRGRDVAVVGRRERDERGSPEEVCSRRQLQSQAYY